jgi:SAM-dependent methyltransferase
MIIRPESDPIGQAITHFYFQQDNSPILVKSEVVEDEQLPPDYFFRSFNDMPMLERLALKHCTGKILDIGAGAGCHTLYLQNKNFYVTALEISELCCNVLRTRGVKNVVNSDILSFHHGKFDTIILLMNGIGIAGSLDGLKTFLTHLKSLLNEGGKILLDSSDLMYLFEDEDGSFVFDINSQNYYGEVDYTLEYKHIKGNTFSWLFADSVILTDIAEEVGLKTKIIEYGPHYDYLAELKLL